MRIVTLLGGLAVILAATNVSPADPPATPKDKNWDVPYRMSGTKHVVVRAKIDGRGPYNFVVDSGAPALIVATAVCDKLGVKADKKLWGVFDTFAIEGGPVLKKEKVRVEDMFQLEGMNGLGLPEMKLDGVIGYSVLARYRLEFDFTADTMTWTELDYTPAPFKSVVGKDAAKAADMEWVGGLAKGLGRIIGKQAQTPARRGSLGVELEDTDDGVRVTRVLPAGPAAAAKAEIGDRVTHAAGRRTRTVAEVLAATADVPPGMAVRLTLIRGGKANEVTIKTEEGL